MNVPVIGFAEGEARLDWLGLTRALAEGHRLPRAELGDTLLYRGDDTMLSRATWIDGLGLAVKTATIFPGNAGRGAPTINGGVALYDDTTGALAAIVDFHLVTRWKTAGDSLLGALRLARPDSRRVLIVGSGTVARSLREAYGAGFPEADFRVWSRNTENARAMAADFDRTEAADDLQEAVGRADIVTSATMAREPILRGDWLRPGQHLDLIGAFKPDMREADDTALTRARLFVDSRDTVLAHNGEFRDPLARGVIGEGDVVADLYDDPSLMARQGAGDITLYKNGGGAHLDLMTCRYVLDRWQGGE